MSRTASCYTNLIKIKAQAKNNKVDYPGHVAKNWNPLAPTLGCNPIFDEQNYIDIRELCQPKKSTIIQPECAFNYAEIVLIYSGGYSETEDPDHYDGGNNSNSTTVILDGGTSTTG
jgi:hypothetical protein